MQNPFRCFNSSPEVIRLTVMMYIGYPLSLRQVEYLLFEWGIDICHETVRFRWNRFGPVFAGEIRKRHVHHRSYSRWRWHLDEAFVKINGEIYYLWRAVDHGGEVLEVFATKRRDRAAALTFLKRTMKRFDRPRSIIADRLRSYQAVMNIIGVSDRQECGRWLNNRAENSHQPFRRREGAMAKFRDIKTLQKFAAAHASIHDHFNQDRRLKRYHYNCHDLLRGHIGDFIRAYNFAKRLKTLKGLTPYEYICRLWIEEPERFRLNPLHQMPGLNN